MTTFHFIRHGEVHNPRNIYYGRLPGFPLTDDGKQCIAYMARQLKQYPIEAIYHSPMLRTQQSAEIIAEVFKLQPQVDERLIEIASFFEGQSRGQAATVSHYPPLKVGKAETMQEIYDRMAHFVRDRAELHPDAHIVAISHNGPINILQRGLLGRALTDEASGEVIPTCGTDTVVTVKGTNITVNRSEL